MFKVVFLPDLQLASNLLTQARDNGTIGLYYGE